MGQRMRTTLQAIKTQLRKRLHEPVNVVGQRLTRVVEGYYRPCCSRKPAGITTLPRALALSVAVRPSWKRICPTFERWLPRAHVLHPYPDVRFDAIHPR